MADPTPTALDQALAAYRATASAYPMPAEKALIEIVAAMAAEIGALRARLDQGQAGATADLRGELQRLKEKQASDQALLLTQLRHEIAAMRRDQSFVQSLETPLRSDDSALRAEIAALRSQVEQLSGQRPNVRRALPGHSAPMRPVEELLDDAPQIDGEYSLKQLAEHLNRPRVRPEDIVLSEHDLERQPHRRGPVSVRSNQVYQLRGRTAAADTRAAQRIVILISLIAVTLILVFWAMNAGM